MGSGQSRENSVRPDHEEHCEPGQKLCFILKATQEMGFKHESGMIQFRRLTLAARVGEGDMVGGEDKRQGLGQGGGHGHEARQQTEGLLKR